MEVADREGGGGGFEVAVVEGGWIWIEFNVKLHWILTQRIPPRDFMNPRSALG
jgi:hypothetical protein